MQTNNTTLLTEISALVLAVLLIIAGAVLLFFGKIDLIYAGYFFAAALGIFGFKSALNAPSPLQTSAPTPQTSVQAQASTPVQPVAAPPPVRPMIAPALAPAPAPTPQYPSAEQIAQTVLRQLQGAYRLQALSVDQQQTQSVPAYSPQQ